MKKINKLAQEIVEDIWGKPASKGGNISNDWFSEQEKLWVGKLKALVHHESTTEKSS